MHRPWRPIVQTCAVAAVAAVLNCGPAVAQTNGFGGSSAGMGTTSPPNSIGLDRNSDVGHQPSCASVGRRSQRWKYELFRFQEFEGATFGSVVRWRRHFGERIELLRHNGHNEFRGYVES